MMQLDEPLYTILLNSDELRYLCETLERQFMDEKHSREISLWLLPPGAEEGVQVILNKAGYDLIAHLQFGGVSCAKMWARMES